MNLIQGEIVLDAQSRDEALRGLDGMIADTLKRGRLSCEMVLDACEALSAMICEEHIPMLESAGIAREIAEVYVRDAKSLLRKETLLARLKMELGDLFSTAGASARVCELDVSMRKTILPLGVLLHITAGNQYGLAFYSVIEGLLTGNLNIVKLSSGDEGLSVMIFKELFKIEPRLKEYVYIFDYSSEETEAVLKLTELANAVVIWGGDTAVQTIRRMLKPDTKLIEWGHKLSFAYITKDGIQPFLLNGLAENIVKTNQLLCSSCQGIFLDTDCMEDVYAFCERFLPILEQCREQDAGDIPMEIRAQTGLLVYTASLSAESRPARAFNGRQSALLAYEDSELETSIPYGNCWVKRLPRARVFDTLRRHKAHLQTVGLLCAEEERETLVSLLWRAGLVRVTYGADMSGILNGEAHDGEYPLMRYIRIVTEICKR